MQLQTKNGFMATELDYTRIVPTIGITMGDPNGIGPEIIVKMLEDERMLRWAKVVLYGNESVLKSTIEVLGLEKFQYQKITEVAELRPQKIGLIDIGIEGFVHQWGVPSLEAGTIAAESLLAAGKDLVAGELHAVVTAPIHKASMPEDLFPFPGHTEFFQSLSGAEEVLMFMIGEDLKIALATVHQPLQAVSKSLSPTIIKKRLALMRHALAQDFGMTHPKIAVLGLNPHAGEAGKIGTEEKDWISPLLEEIRNQGDLVFGPYPADGFFASRTYTKFDGVLAMYHDQGLIPFKMLAFEDGVNYSAGLPVIRTSPDHGTAFDIAGKGLADESSIRSAFFLAIDIFNQRREPMPSQKQEQSQDYKKDKKVKWFKK